MERSNIYTGVSLLVGAESLFVKPSTANLITLVESYVIFPKDEGLKARWVPYFETFKSFAERVGIHNIIALKVPLGIKTKHSTLMAWHAQNCPVGHC